ncbi:MAG: hypothetical protein EOP09_19765 [Proteobacteria bacterium]|nr:MAG: hypothetical protein EOP09_19765 [Pseudomonadota bacterium]
MNTKDICRLIPDEVRSKRLLTSESPILNAELSLSNANMALLVDVWKAFVEPNKEITTCPICLDNIRTNFRIMLPLLIELEEEYLKLDMI